MKRRSRSHSHTETPNLLAANHQSTIDGCQWRCGLIGTRLKQISFGGARKGGGMRFGWRCSVWEWPRGCRTTPGSSMPSVETAQADALHSPNLPPSLWPPTLGSSAPHHCPYLSPRVCVEPFNQARGRERRYPSLADLFSPTLTYHPPHGLSHSSHIHTHIHLSTCICSILDGRFEVDIPLPGPRKSDGGDGETKEKEAEENIIASIEEDTDLWSPSNPFLYSLVVSLYLHGSLLQAESCWFVFYSHFPLSFVSPHLLSLGVMGRWVGAHRVGLRSVTIEEGGGVHGNGRWILV